MRTKSWWQKYSSLIFIGGAIPVVILLSSSFNWPNTALIPVIVILSLIFSAVALWTYANRETNDSDWWQDESASGWRGY